MAQHTTRKSNRAYVPLKTRGTTSRSARAAAYAAASRKDADVTTLRSLRATLTSEEV